VSRLSPSSSELQGEKKLRRAEGEAELRNDVWCTGGSSVRVGRRLTEAGGVKLSFVMGEVGVVLTDDAGEIGVVGEDEELSSEEEVEEKEPREYVKAIGGFCLVVCRTFVCGKYDVLCVEPWNALVPASC
jgi:hypothetical protein